MLKTAVIFFIMLNSIGTLPIFLALTNGLSLGERFRVALVASLAAAVTLLCFIWTGEYFMQFFGLSIPAFGIGGGIILFKIGMEMLNCSVDLEKALREMPASFTKRSNAIVPLGVPLLAGPGSIAVTMTMTVGATQGIGAGGLSAALFIAVIPTLTVWVGGSQLFAKINMKSISDLLTRLGGFFLMVLAVQMILNGLRDVVASLK